MRQEALDQATLLRASVLVKSDETTRSAPLIEASGKLAYSVWY